MTLTDPTSDTAGLPKDVAANPVLSQWVTVRADCLVEVRVGKVELGQGILTALAQLAAEELDVPLERIRMLPARTGEGPAEGLTSGSMSVAEAGQALRLICANVRARFVAEAARRWGEDVAGIQIESGSIQSHQGTPHTTYGELSDIVDLDAETNPDVSTKSVDAVRIIGTSAARLDLPDKIAGRPSFITDLRLDGQMFGRVIRPPSPGAQLSAVSPSTVSEMDVRVVQDGSFLGVVGKDEATVMRAVETLRNACTWNESTRLPDENRLVTFLKAGPHETISVADETSDNQVATTHRACYSRPFLAHASIAPSCGVARWTNDGGLEVWSHSQGIHRLRDAIAQCLDIDATTVTVRHVENAGCYGHNGADDAAFDAVLLARVVPGRPVQVQWSRQDELTWAPFGSTMVVEVEAGVDDSGGLHSWTYDVWSQGHTSRPGFAGAPGLLAGMYLDRPLSSPAAVDPPLGTGGGSTRNAMPIYDVGRRRITGHRLLQTPIRSSALRALGAYMNVFSIECFMDELADAAGADPLEYRLRHLRDDRGRTVLQTVAAAAGWGDATRDGFGRGIGFARYKDKGAYCAVIAEVEAEHEIRVRKLTVAIDVGRVVSPDGVCNQVEGGAIQATSWTLKERVRFDRRRVTSDDWESYPILRFSEVPEIDVHLVDRPDLLSVGAGEAAQGPTAGAVGNAVAAAVGVRIRDLPLTRESVVAAIEADGD